jgi:predicted nucleic acid-binding protein
MYLLDTNILSELIRREPNPSVVARFEAVPDEELFTSAICVEEVAFGARIAPPDNRIWERFEDKILPWLTVLDFDLNSALTGGPMRGDWQQQGTSVGYADALIAATARAYGLTLVTRNVQHFDHVVGLKVENWFEPPSAPAPPGPT